MAILSDWLKDLTFEVLQGSTGVPVCDVVYDSRKAGPETVFLCWKGLTRDSHDFLEEVYEKGCRAFVVEREAGELPLSACPDAAGIRVPDGRKTLALLSAARFGYPAKELHLIGITGTKGKTTVSYLIRSMLEEAGKKTGVIGTNGCTIAGEVIQTKNTTPDGYELNRFFRLMADRGCEYCVMECSSQGFKLDRTYGLRFDTGIFLNISNDHIGPLEHQDFAEYLFCKSRLFTQSERLIVNADDPRTKEALALAGISPDGSLADGGRKELYTFGIREKADLGAENIRNAVTDEYLGIGFTLTGMLSGSYDISMVGEFNVDNALAALLAAHFAGADPESCCRALAKVRVNGRSEEIFNTHGFRVLVDYAHNEISMVSLIRTLRTYDPKRVVIVFGSGGNRSVDRRIGMGKAAAEADFLVFTADNSRYEKTEDIIAAIDRAYLEAGGRPENRHIEPDRAKAIRYAIAHAREGDIIAVIGKGHEDYQEIEGVRHHFSDKEEILEAVKLLYGEN